MNAPSDIPETEPLLRLSQLESQLEHANARIAALTREAAQATHDHERVLARLWYLERAELRGVTDPPSDATLERIFDRANGFSGDTRPPIEMVHVVAAMRAMRKEG